MREYYLNKVAVITGAASGLGLGYTERLLEYGAAAVWMSDYNEQALTEVAKPLCEKYPGKVHPLVVNAMVREDVEGLIRHAALESGQIDLLFNNAGKPMTMPTETIPVEDFEALVQLNLMGAVYGTLAALPYMLEQKSGHVINTASVGGLIPPPFQTAYAATKAAVITMTRCMSVEYEGRGLYFSQVSPMNVATNIFKVQPEKIMRAQGLPEKEIQRRLALLAPPAGAMPLEEALDYILEHIASRDVDIVLGQDGRDLYRLFCTDRPAFTQIVRELGGKRRAFYEAKARGEDVPFPG